MVLTRDDVPSLQEDSPKLESLIARHRAWWTLDEVDRPLVSVGRYAGLRPHPSGRTFYVTLDELPDLDESMASLEAHFAEHGIVSGEVFRAAAPGGFPPLAETIVGCPCKVDSATNTYWLEPLPGGWEQAQAITHDTGREWVEEYTRRTRRMAEWVDGRWPMGAMNIRGLVDTFAAMLGPQKMVEVMLDEPDEAKRVLAVCTDNLIAMCRAYRDALPPFRGGHFVSGLYVPGSTVFFNVDAGCLFSREIYDEFFLPCDRRLCEAFDHPLVHTHSVSHHHWDDWLTIPNLRIQTVIDPVGPTFDELLPGMRRIQAQRSFLLRPTDDQIYDAMTKLSPRGLYVDVYYPW
ncbi:MAG: hypothetical protein HYY04_16025 [Chloroflexi bacterium]|nr:hypothetical protein [Chloroflexota bacterium]